MKYYLFSLCEETFGKLIGPFKTIERAIAYKKKHHSFAEIIERKENNNYD